ncbi:MAG: FHA domain-containing protein [Verrucomicrobiales bacterium]
MPTIILNMPDGEAQSFDIAGSPITVGRNEDNSIVIDESSLSGSHAEFPEADGGYVLVDPDSTNVTLVNGAPPTDSPLQHGAAISFGTLQAPYQTEEGAAAGADAEEESYVPDSEDLTAEIGESSARPDDFSSISPFPTKKKKSDPVATLVLALGALSILASIGVAALAAMMKAS